MKFIGVDLAWSPERRSGLACLRFGVQKPIVEHLRHLLADEEIIAQILSWKGRTTATVAVDAPLIVENISGARYCDRLVSALYQKYEAGCYPANLSLLSRNRRRIVRPVGFADRLRNQSFLDFLDAGTPDRTNTFFETYPHAAFVSIFRRDRILKYKRAPAEKKDEALREYYGYLKRIMEWDPDAAESLDRALAEKKWKVAEDMLDAALCGYVAYLSIVRHRIVLVFGDRRSGYMMLPFDDRIRRNAAVDSLTQDESATAIQKERLGGIGLEGDSTELVHLRAGEAQIFAIRTSSAADAMGMADEFLELPYPTQYYNTLAAAVEALAPIDLQHGPQEIVLEKQTALAADLAELLNSRGFAWRWRD